MQVVLSRGPQPINVPSLTGEDVGVAAARLHRSHLGDRVRLVAAPGTAPGTVTGQSPVAGHQLHPNDTVTLLVAETPSWKDVTSFSGSGSGQSIPFHIRGTQWRLVYSMSYQGTCDFVFFCNGPNAQVVGVGSANSTQLSFDLSSGTSETRVFKTGAGTYQVAIKPGWDSAQWSIQVQDYY